VPNGKINSKARPWKWEGSPAKVAIRFQRKWDREIMRIVVRSTVAKQQGEEKTDRIQVKEEHHKPNPARGKEDGQRTAVGHIYWGEGKLKKEN